MPNRVIIGSQWGDEGKAKIVDYLTLDSDIVIRFQGGANAGHTVEVGDEKFIFHLIPSGIMHPDKTCVIGNGVVLDPKQVITELDELAERGISCDGRLFISDSAHVVFPYHIRLDQLQEKAAGKQAIGTTGRGIGPAYADKITRSGIRMGDILDTQNFEAKLKKAVAEKNELFAKMYGGEPLSADEIFSDYVEYGQKLKAFVTDTAVYLHQQAKNGKSFVFEGAQGTILDIDHGTHPYVTSSNTVAAAASSGSGVGLKSIDHVVGVVKAYTTRVGNGPFPTELLDSVGEDLREIGKEFGATTGRPRRCGWFDAVVVRKAAMVNGLTHLAITKMDVMDDFEEIKICTGYEINGKETPYFPTNIDKLALAKPIYETHPGWKQSTCEATSWNQLPKKAQKYLERIVELVEIPIGMVSVGPKRHQTIQISL